MDKELRACLRLRGDCIEGDCQFYKKTDSDLGMECKDKMDISRQHCTRYWPHCCFDRACSEWPDCVYIVPTYPKKD